MKNVFIKPKTPPKIGLFHEDWPKIDQKCLLLRLSRPGLHVTLWPPALALAPFLGALLGRVLSWCRLWWSYCCAWRGPRCAASSLGFWSRTMGAAARVLRGPPSWYCSVPNCNPGCPALWPLSLAADPPQCWSSRQTWLVTLAALLFLVMSLARSLARLLARSLARCSSSSTISALCSLIHSSWNRPWLDRQAFCSCADLPRPGPFLWSSPSWLNTKIDISENEKKN